MFRITCVTGSPRRRGAVAITVSFCLILFVGFGALVVDVGTIHNVRADLQRAADAGALAGASALTSDTMLQIRLGTVSSSLTSALASMTSGRTNVVAAINPSFGTTSTIIDPNDLLLGQMNLSSATSFIQTGVPATSYNAVTVLARRQIGGSNGGIDLFFAGLFGRHVTEAAAIASAAFDDRVAGFDIGEAPDILMPFTVSETVYNAQLIAGHDGYEYDALGDVVLGNPDGVPEISLYPDDYGPGNFGLLNIGTPNQGVPALRIHIEYGVPPEDMIAEVGTNEMIFYDQYGNQLTYDITGNPGLKATLESSIATRIGDVIAFLIHNQASGSGSNLTYTIKDIRYARIMDIELNGPPSGKKFWVQPVSYSGGGVILDPNAPSSNGMAGRVVLVR